MLRSIKLTAVFLFFSVFALAQNKELANAKDTVSSDRFKYGIHGSLYHNYTNNPGPKIQPGDFISAKVIAKTESDSILVNTYKSEFPTYMLVPKNRTGVIDCLRYFAEGDSALVKVAVDSAYVKGVFKPNIKGKYINYTIKIEKLISHQDRADSVFNKQVQAYIRAEGEIAKNTEAGNIKNYIRTNRLDLASTPSGLKYAITRSFGGERPMAHDTAVVWYTAKLLNGTFVESNIRSVVIKNNKFNETLSYKPIHVPLGEKRTIAGWDEAMLLMRKGEKATFVMPSKLCYGDQGYANIIPPYAPMLFEIELIDVIHPRQKTFIQHHPAKKH